MTFNAGELVAKIRLDGKAQFDRDVDGSGQKFTAAQKLADAAGKGIASAFTTASVGIGVASVASTAYIASLFKTGVAYNTLQQTSRAALNTLLGGATAANAQMDKLDAFARNSPFSKSVFISAQQQLIGFGMEASKVIPTLNAVQNAVAAVGGSNQDIAGIVEIIAKIGSSSKITAEDLNQLGGYGLDAATLIGTSMGKSGAEIRASITAGTLGAGEAVDALVASMDSKFSGAAANVKNTFSGTVDRIKAASRDIGAALAEPFVAKNGGGLFVTWGNQVADVMRAVEGHVGPVVSIVTARALPAFADLTGMLDKARVIVKSWDSSRLEASLNTLASNGPAVAAVAGAMLSVNATLLSSIPIVGKLVPAFNPVVGALIGIAAASPEVRSALSDLFGSFKPLVPQVVELGKVLSSSLNLALPITAGLVKTTASAITPLVQAVAQIPTPMILAVGAFVALNKGMQTLAPGIQSAVTAFKLLQERMAVQAALGAMEGNTSRLAGAFGVAGTAAQGLGTALKTAFLANPVGLVITAASIAAAGLAAALGASAQAAAAADKRMQAVRETLNQTTGAVTDATRAQIRKNLEDDNARKYAEALGVSLEDAVKAANGTADSYDKVKKAADGWADGTNKNLEGQNNLTLAMNGTDDAGLRLMRTIDEQRAATDDGTQSIREKIQAERDNMAQMDDAGRANYRFQEAMKIVSDETRTAEERVNALRQALDLLKGGSISAQDAQLALAKTTLGMKEALAQATEEGVPLWKTYLDGAGNINLSTRAGIDFQSMLKDSRTKMLDAATAASDFARANGDADGAQQAATEAARGYVSALEDTLRAAELTEDQIKGITDAALDTPESVGILVTTNGTSMETIQSFIDLQAQAAATPDAKTITVTDPGSDAVLQRLKNLGLTVEQLPEGKVRITSSGEQSVRETLNKLTEPREVIITARTRDGGGSFANGGFNQYANGGITKYANGGVANHLQTFAAGGFPSGIYKGRAAGIHKFAELETGWEAYVSGRPGMEERNRGVLTEAGKRLGMTFVPTGAQRSTAAPSVTGATPVSFAQPRAAAPELRPINVNVYAAPGMDEEHLVNLTVAKVARELR